MNLENKLKSEEAGYRMKLSHDLSIFIRKAYDMFGDAQQLIGKNLTPTSFWFFIDALYFELDPKEDLKQIQVRRKAKLSNVEEFDEFEDLQFILKMRKLVSNQKMGTLNLQDIRETPIDEVINIANNYLQSLQLVNDKKIEDIRRKQGMQREQIKKQLKKFNIKLKQSHPMFIYQEFEEEICKRWRQEDAQLQNKQKCYLCSLPHKLISCNRCSLKVHPGCYPTFSFQYDTKNLRPTEQELKNFICENCLNKVDFENQKCDLCCCSGGYFVKISSSESNLKMKFTKQGIDETSKSTHIDLKIQNFQQKNSDQKYIHLTCFIWNTQLKWNHKTNSVENLAIIVKKKATGMCSLCGISFGAAIPCSNESCRRFYHGECAKRHGLQMGLIRAKTSVIELFCERHRHLKRSESLQQSELNRFREMKKMIQGFDKQIKRLNVTASYQQVKLIAERDHCSICGKQEGWQKITICKQCRKWYHNSCSNQCKNCA